MVFLLFGWGGMMHDAATGLYQGTLAREYDPSTGRWNSPDPAGQQIGVTNLYVYANNQTTSHTDVTGLWWLADAWNATSNYVSNAASQAAQAVTNAFRTVVTAAGDFAAKAVETLKDGANAVTWLTTEAGKQLMVLGNQAVDAALSTAKSFMTYLDQFGRSFNDLWTQLQKFGNSAKQVLQAIVNDPITFFKNLAAGVGQGIKDFITNIGSTLKDALLNWLGGSTWQNLAAILPSSWTDPKAVGQFLLDFFSLGWNSIQNSLVNTLGASNIALVTQLYTEMQQFIAKGTQGVFAWLETAQAKLDPSVLVQKAIDAGVQYVIENLVPKALEYIAQLLPIPGPQVLVQIYNTVDWVFNSLGKFQQLAQIATDIVGQIGAVVKGQTSVLSGQITSFLNGLVPVGITYLATQLGIGNLPGELSDKIATLQNYPLSLVQQGIKYLADKAKELLGLKNDQPASKAEGLISKPITFTVAGGATHQLWVVNQNGTAMIMRASNTAPLNLSLDLLAETTKEMRASILGFYNTVVNLCNQKIQLLQTKPTDLAGATALDQRIQATLKQLERALVAANAGCFKEVSMDNIQWLPGATASPDFGAELAVIAKRLLVTSGLTFPEANDTTVGVTRIKQNGQWVQIVAINGVSSKPSAVAKLRKVVQAAGWEFIAVPFDKSRGSDHPDTYLYDTYHDAPGFTAIGISNRLGPCAKCKSYFATVEFPNVYWNDKYIPVGGTI